MTVLPAPASRCAKGRRLPSGRRWPAVSGLTALLASGSVFTTPQRAQWLVVLGGLVAVLVVGRPALRGHRRHPLALISVGLWLTALGEVLHAAGASYPSYADAVELGAYPAIILGLLRLVRVRLTERSLDTLLVAAITPTALGAIVWVPLATAVSRWVPGAQHAAWVTVAFLAVDGLAVAMLARLTLMFRGRPLSYQLLLAAFGCLLGAHVSRVAATMTSVVPAPFGSQTLLIVAFGLLSAAALHPSLLPDASAPPALPAPIGRGHVTMLAVAVVGAPLAVTLPYAHLSQGALLAVGAPALVSLLVVAHLGRLVRERSRLEHRSAHDLLTALPNRGHFQEELVRALVCGGDRPFAVGFLDLDRFKKVNDSLGHDAGDELLRQVAARLTSGSRTGDVVARLAGDEFGLLLRDVSGEGAAVAEARAILDAFAPVFSVAGRELFMTPSIGLALAPSHGTDAETLLKNADLAMYEAKRLGRNTVEVFTPSLGAGSHQQLALETRLHTGIEAGELIVHYQPKVNLRTGDITGVEALVRWQHPTIGLVPPTAFMHLAEESGLIASIGEQVLQIACRQVQQWRDNGSPSLTVSVNVSTRQFQLQDVAAVVADALAASGLPAHALELEITESAELSQAELVGTVLQSLRSLGVRCSIDDFGTGYTGIAYLNDLPVDKIKLDKSFIDEIGSGGQDAPFVRAMIAMAHSLGLEVIAEGVETAGQALYLREQGCDTMQGFLFSQPLPPDDLQALLGSLSGVGGEAAGHPMPGAVPSEARYGAATDAGALGDLLWRDEQLEQPAVGLHAELAELVSESASLTRYTLVLSSVAGVLTLPLLLGLGSAGALPPAVQTAMETVFQQAGVTADTPSPARAAAQLQQASHRLGRRVDPAASSAHSRTQTTSPHAAAGATPRRPAGMPAAGAPSSRPTPPNGPAHPATGGPDAGGKAGQPAPGTPQGKGRTTTAGTPQGKGRRSSAAPTKGTGSNSGTVGQSGAASRTGTPGKPSSPPPTGSAPAAGKGPATGGQPPSALPGHAAP